MDATSQTSLAHGRDRNVDVLFTGPLVSCPRQRRGASRFACENAPVDCGMTSLIAGTPSTSAAQEAPRRGGRACNDPHVTRTLAFGERTSSRVFETALAHHDSVVGFWVSQEKRRWPLSARRRTRRCWENSEAT